MTVQQLFFFNFLVILEWLREGQIIGDHTIVLAVIDCSFVMKHRRERVL